jgi:hypothetical protein
VLLYVVGFMLAFIGLKLAVDLFTIATSYFKKRCLWCFIIG